MSFKAGSFSVFIIVKVKTRMILKEQNTWRFSNKALVKCSKKSLRLFNATLINIREFWRIANYKTRYAVILKPSV